MSKMEKALPEIPALWLPKHQQLRGGRAKHTPGGLSPPPSLPEVHLQVPAATPLPAFLLLLGVTPPPGEVTWEDEHPR